MSPYKWSNEVETKIKLFEQYPKTLSFNKDAGRS